MNFTIAAFELKRPRPKNEWIFHNRNKENLALRHDIDQSVEMRYCIVFSVPTVFLGFMWGKPYSPGHLPEGDGFPGGSAAGEHPLLRWTWEVAVTFTLWALTSVVRKWVFESRRMTLRAMILIFRWLGLISDVRKWIWMVRRRVFEAGVLFIKIIQMRLMTVKLRMFNLKIVGVPSSVGRDKNGLVFMRWTPIWWM